MATIETSQFGNSSCPYIRLTVTESESTNTIANLAWTLYYVVPSSAVSSSKAREYTVKINGSTVKTGTYVLGGKTGINTIASGTTSISRGTSSKSVSISVTFDMSITWHGTSGGTRSASGNINIAAKPSYTISYNANGGSGAPNNQTKWYGTDILISSTKPTRTGYSFVRWNTNTSNSGSAYSPGSKYTSNANLTLYAIWSANTYTVKYDANGGSGAPSAQTKTYGKTLTLSSTKPTRSNYSFSGWATSSGGSVAYAAGGSYTANAGIILYAVWTLAYVKPYINSISVNRCDSKGNLNNTGSYAKIVAEWETFGSVKPILNVTWNEPGATSSSSIKFTSTTTGKTGTISGVFGSGKLTNEKSYTVTAILNDGTDNSRSKILAISSDIYPIDFLGSSEGTGTAIGKVAELPNVFDIGWETKHRDHSKFDNDKAIIGIDLEGNEKQAIVPCTQYGNLAIGFSNYEMGNGDTNIYGNDICFGIGSVSGKTIYYPYLKKGDSVSGWWQGAGYVTSAGTYVCFCVPLAKPIIDNPTVTVTSVKGLMIRQNNKYLFGSSSNVYVNPKSYSANVEFSGNFISITAIFDNTTNVTNNSPLGISANIQIKFS